MTANEILKQFKNNRLTEEEALLLVGQEMEKSLLFGGSAKTFENVIDEILGTPSEPDPEDKALAGVWERNKRKTNGN